MLQRSNDLESRKLLSNLSLASADSARNTSSSILHFCYPIITHMHWL